MISNILVTLLEFVQSLGYVGIFLMTFIEGTFIPIPSEVTLIPAGYLAATGYFKLYAVLIYGILGTICGALFNYMVAYKYGKQIILRFGKYIFLSEKKLKKIEIFFQNHGRFSVFIGRIIPGLKHFISFPAGLAKMNIVIFAIYSGAGGGIWCSALVISGYFIAKNEKELNHYTTHINYVLLSIVVISVVIYVCKAIYFKKKK